MHKGFHDAYMSVHADILDRLEGHEDLPLYITGHSLGGAIAVAATWFQSSPRLAACYTFGAPRVGDQGLIDRFKTPVYRIVNGPDPVTLVPPSGFGLDVLKGIIRVLGVVLPFWGWAGWVTDLLIRVQRFRHYGYMRYLTVAVAGPKGDYPRFDWNLPFPPFSALAVSLDFAPQAQPIVSTSTTIWPATEISFGRHALRRNQE